MEIKLLNVDKTMNELDILLIKLQFQLGDLILS